MVTARQVGLPTDFLDNPKVYKEALKVTNFIADKPAIDAMSPELRGWVNRFGLMKLVRDDLGSLNAASVALSKYVRLREGGIFDRFARGLADNLFKSYAETNEMRAAEEVPTIGPLAEVLSPEVLTPEERKEMYLSQAEFWRGAAESVRPTPFRTPGGWRGWAGDLAEGLPYTLAGMPLSAALSVGGGMLGGPLGAMAGSALAAYISSSSEAEMEQARAWKEFTAGGMDPREAYRKTLFDVYLPNMGILYLSDFIQNRLTFGAGGGWLKKGLELLASGGFEAGEEIAQGVVSNLSLGRENNWPELFYEGSIGFGMGMVFGGGGMAVRTAADRLLGRAEERLQAAAAEQIGQVFEEAEKAISASKTLERMPEVLERFIKEVTKGGFDSVYMDGETFFQTFGEKAEEMAEALGIAGQMEEAKAGADIKIPAVKMARNPEVYERVRNDIRFEENGMSRNEAKKAQAARSEDSRKIVKEAAKLLETVKNEGEEALSVKEDFKARLERLGLKWLGKREAEAYSTVLTAGLANEARTAKMGLKQYVDSQPSLRFMYSPEAGVEGREQYFTQPMNPDVDLDAEVPVLELQSDTGTPVTRKTILDRLATLVEEGAFITLDELGELEIPDSKGKRKHLAYSSRMMTSEETPKRQARDISLMSLADIARGSVLIESSDNNDAKKKEAKSFHRFYIPVKTGDGIFTIRLVAESLDDKTLRPVKGEIYDLIVDKESASPHSRPDSGESHRVIGSEAPSSRIRIREMLRGVKDAEGEPYVFEQTAYHDGAPSVDSSEFRRFFGDSKVVNENGEPQVMYHVTDSVFDTFQSGNSAGTYYFAPTPKAAKKAARGKKLAMPVYLRMENPVNTKDNPMPWYEAENDFSVAKWREQKYDGVYVKDESGISIAVFSPEQIKSVNNQGTWNTHDPNIYQQSGGENAKTADRLQLGERPATAEENIRRGSEAMERVIAERIGIENAMWREGVGGVSFLWGRPGKGKKFKGGWGISHIIAKRNSKGYDGEAVAKKLVEVIAYGKQTDKYEEHGKTKINVEHDGYRAILSQVIDADSNRRTWLLTGFFLGEEKAESDIVSGISGPALPDATLSETTPHVAEEVADSTFEDSLPSASEIFKQLNEAENQERIIKAATIFRDEETIIRLFQAADRSSFLHEMGHFFLESRRRLSLMEGIDGRVREDWTATVKWLGVENVDFSRPLSKKNAKRWKNAQEKWAAAFEKYLMEGKAPSSALARAFRDFRRWLTDIYRAVKNIVYIDADGKRQTFEMSDEIRGVMDRLLASEEEIEAANETRALGEAKRKLLESGIPDEMIKEYEEVVWAAEDASKAQLLKILNRELTDEYRARLKEVRKQRTIEAREKIAQIPRYRAYLALRQRGGPRLSLKDLTERYGLAVTKELPRGVSSTDGLNIDLAAETLGYENADSLVEDLKIVGTAVPYGRAIQQAVDASMKGETSLLYRPEDLKVAVDRALHIDARLAEILKRREIVLAKLGERSTNARSRATEGTAMLEAAQDKAREILWKKNLMDAAAAGRYVAAETRARKNALAALDRAEREVTKRASLSELKYARKFLDMETLNHALAAESTRIREETEKALRYVKQLWKNRKKLEARIGEDNWAQIRGLMERFGFWKIENQGKSDRKEPLSKWAGRLEIGVAALPDFALREGTVFDKFNRMTWEQFYDVIDTVRMIEHVGRNENTLLLDGRKKAFQALREELIAGKVANYGEIPPADTDPAEGEGRIARARQMVSKYFSDLTAVEFMMRQMDKYKDLEKWWSAIFKPIADAERREVTMKADMVKAVTELFGRLGRDAKSLKEKVETIIINPATGKRLRLTRENLLVIALNWGTKRNRQRLMGGLLEDIKWNDERAVQEATGAIETTLENLTDKDWDFVQGIWDLFESYWPQVAELEKQVSGLTPEKEKAVATRTSSGRILRGGYFPIRYNPLKNLKAAKHEAQRLEKSLTETPYGRASVAHGYTKGRVEVVNRQVSMKLDTIARHLNEVAHDLTHRMAVRDVSRIINDDDLAAHLNHVLGRDNYEQLNPWLMHIANSALTNKNVTAMEKIVQKTTSNIAAAYMGLKVSTGVKQLAGFGPAADRLGTLRLTRTIWNYLGDAGKWNAVQQDVFEKSAYMSDRAGNFDRDIKKAITETTMNRLQSHGAGFRQFMFWWAGEMDSFISIPVWLASYEKGLNDFAAPDTDEKVLRAKAVEYADMIVRTTQNAGAAKDLAAIQRGGPLLKLFTMFYTGIGRLFNLTREEFGKGHGIKDIPRLAAHILAVYTVPFLITNFIAQRSFGPGEDGDDEDGNVSLAWLWWLGKSTLSEMTAPLVGFRDLANLVFDDYSYRSTPLDELGKSLERMIKMVKRAADDDKEMDWEKFTKESITLTGPVFGLPSKQVLASWNGFFEAMEQWDEREGFGGVLSTAWDVLMGPVKKD
jgi:hypothetical protein